MMTAFHETASVLQFLLLVLSQFTILVLLSSIVLLFHCKCKRSKLLSLCAVLLPNMLLYIWMQVNSSTNGAEQTLRLSIPYMVLVSITALSLAFGIGMLFNETKNRRTISNMSIKEAFDNLPTGVCFFSPEGLPVLCNLAMYRFSFAVCGKDVQFITDLESCFVDHFVPVDGTVKDGDVFVLRDGRAWHLEKRFVTHESGSVFTQYIAADVTDLHTSRVELTQENEQLRKVQAELQRLSANVIAVTREEEILNTKMRVHDEMGRCLVAMSGYLKQDRAEHIPDGVALSWQKAISMLKYNNDTPDEDMLSQIRTTCESVKLRFIQTGTLPKEKTAAYLLTCAVRECVTNAVRYAGADELYADFAAVGALAIVTVTNNGRAPEGEIVEGGGLSTLRRRVERAGGIMTVQSLPHFRLTVTVPKGREGVL